MKNSLLDCNLTEENYNDYIERVYNIFRLSSKKSSIILRLNIKKEKCIIELKIISQNGDKEEFSDVSFRCNDLFYNVFLDSLIKKLNDNDDFIINDIVNLDNDEYVTFRLVSSNNDLITIDGLSKEKAEYLKDLFSSDEKKTDNLISNNSGIANIWIFILMIVILIIAFILVVWIDK